VAAAAVGVGTGVGVAGSGVGDGTAVALGASVAEAGSVGGTSVGGGDAVPARATGFTVGVPSTVTLTERWRLNKKNPIAITTIRTPSASATHGHRFEGSPGSMGSIAGGRTLIFVAAGTARSGPSSSWRERRPLGRVGFTTL
jgi:hypothetical protein